MHWGVDLRAPEGSPIVAPASGVVTLADDLYFEGGAVFLDHGHGSFYIDPSLALALGTSE